MHTRSFATTALLAILSACGGGDTQATASLDQPAPSTAALAAAPGEGTPHDVRLLGAEGADWTQASDYVVVERRIVGTDPLSRARSLLSVLEDGPNEAERARGIAPTMWPSDEAAYSLTMAGDRLLVDFTERYADTALRGDSGGSGELGALLANVFNVEGIGSLELRVGGSCEALHRYSGDGSPSSGCVVRTSEQAKEWNGG